MRRVATYAAASSEPDQRSADTTDTYLLFADLNHLARGETVLIVTSAIYVPYQHIDAIRALSTFGVEIETVGTRRTVSGPTHPPHAYRQEIRSAIRSSERYFSARQ